MKGITRDHSRDYLPVVATSRRFMETRRGVDIEGENRTLQAFSDSPVDELAWMYDLLVIDHPWVGFAARHEVLLPLDEDLPPRYVRNQAENPVGVSHPSYAIGAAAPVAANRPDVFERENLTVPDTWEGLLALADRDRAHSTSGSHTGATTPRQPGGDTDVNDEERIRGPTRGMLLGGGVRCPLGDGVPELRASPVHYPASERP